VSPPPRAGSGRLGLLALGLLAAGLLAWALGLHDVVRPDRLARLRTEIEAYGPWAPALYVGGYIIAELLFVPALPLTLLGGLVFGAIALSRPGAVPSRSTSRQASTPRDSNGPMTSTTAPVPDLPSLPTPKKSSAATYAAVHRHALGGQCAGRVRIDAMTFHYDSSQHPFSIARQYRCKTNTGVSGAAALISSNVGIRRSAN